MIGQAVITNGEWEYPGGAPAALGGKLYIWSNYGFASVVTVTN